MVSLTTSDLEPTSQQPIGIFDSGLGGLTVLNAIAKALPYENLIYLGDTARVPYGVKSPQTITRYSQEICDFLIHHQVKAIVVACNTASAFALPYLQEIYSIPVLGVLRPGVIAALKATQTHQVGVIGTTGTIQSQSYTDALRNHHPEIQVFSQACPLFVPLVEEGWIDHPITYQVAEIYLKAWQQAKIDTLILGCTHYPLLKGVLQKTMGPQIKLVDSALEAAHSLQELLQMQSLLASKDTQPTRRYFATDAPEKMQHLAKLFLGHEIKQVEWAKLSH